MGLKETDSSTHWELTSNDRERVNINKWAADSPRSPSCNNKHRLSATGPAGKRVKELQCKLFLNHKHRLLVCFWPPGSSVLPSVERVCLPNTAHTLTFTAAAAAAPLHDGARWQTATAHAQCVEWATYHVVRATIDGQYFGQYIVRLLYSYFFVWVLSKLFLPWPIEVMSLQTSLFCFC